MPSRHLGLISTLENKILKTQIEKTSKIISKFIDIKKIIKIAKTSIDLN